MCEVGMLKSAQTFHPRPSERAPKNVFSWLSEVEKVLNLGIDIFSNDLITGRLVILAPLQLMPHALAAHAYVAVLLKLRDFSDRKKCEDYVKA